MAYCAIFSINDCVQKARNSCGKHFATIENQILTMALKNSAQNQKQMYTYTASNVLDVKDTTFFYKRSIVKGLP